MKWLAWCLLALLPTTLLGATPPSWEPLEAAVRAQIQAERMPGAVVIVGDARGVLYRQAFGTRGPPSERMTEDTIFDLASLTKAVATTTAVLQLAERHQLTLDQSAARYWPEFAGEGKGDITVRQLLAHSSGLPVGLDLGGSGVDREEMLRRILAVRPVAEPGRQVLYSDINFEVLGVLVERVSGEPLEVYCQRHIFQPLGMHDSGFLPPESRAARIAPTSVNLPRGQVHDPAAALMGGVSGHAGLFSSADDLALFAQMLLNEGRQGLQQILQPQSVALLFQPQSPTGAPGWRGAGWALDAPLVANRDVLPPVGMIGHTGFAGTGLWIDRVTQRFLIVLSNRVYLAGSGDAQPLRRQLLALLASLEPPRTPAAIAADPVLAAALLPQPASLPEGRPQVDTGIDVLERQAFAPLTGLRVGLITNPSGVDARGWRTIDRLRWAPGGRLGAIFSPEQGADSDGAGKVVMEAEPFSGLPWYRLYGAARRPPAALLAGLDALVVDIQDAGVRPYPSTQALPDIMAEAAARGLPVFILDRPNPLGAERVDGPLSDEDPTAATGTVPLPLQHGMTLGELARLFNAEKRLGTDLTVIAMRGYRRGMRFEETGLSWQPPSPNWRTLTQVRLYPGIALVEGANVSVGRGTVRPFEWLGAPWIDGPALAAYLNTRAIPGVRFEPAEFVPDENPYRGERCQGVRLILTDRQALRAPLLGVELLGALQRLYPEQLHLAPPTNTPDVREILGDLARGKVPRRIAADWLPALQRFRERRASYLLY
ncbi:serine hydrolase [Pseudogulbenkiania sp. MAI-1]|uniref:serine hydrolase n=1 Tax=Pseudogulbenkiania sp. MAI-1 TaxID=990370 RepID=UPI00045EAD97|nr:serine hydrolase [Pseudogulbenkiania sp. MAI-1]